MTQRRQNTQNPSQNTQERWLNQQIDQRLIQLHEQLQENHREKVVNDIFSMIENLESSRIQNIQTQDKYKIPFFIVLNFLIFTCLYIIYIKFIHQLEIIQIENKNINLYNLRMDEIILLVYRSKINNNIFF